MNDVLLVLPQVVLFELINAKNRINLTDSSDRAEKN